MWQETNYDSDIMTSEVSRNKEATALMKDTAPKSIVPPRKRRDNSSSVMGAVTPKLSPNATLATTTQEVPEKGPWKGPRRSRLRLSYRDEEDDNCSDDDGPAADPRRASCYPDTKRTRKHKQRRTLECVVAMYWWRLKEL